MKSESESKSVAFIYKSCLGERIDMQVLDRKYYLDIAASEPGLLRLNRLEGRRLHWAEWTCCDCGNLSAESSDNKHTSGGAKW